ncbi:BamA/TamA family outer membrane protein [Dokdonia sp.]|uniref:BamA/TamA family outer membrane protein n=1 Tax=Dokdonia sp. TaxID=2024995 RepID=UPI00326403A1
MRRIIYFFHILYIYTTSVSFAQEEKLTLKIQGITDTETKVIDSLGYAKTYNELTPLLKTIDSLKSNLSQLGYIDISEQRSNNKFAYTSILNLGKRYTYIKIYVGSDKSIKEYFKQANIKVKNDSVVIETAFAKAALENLTYIAANSGNPFTSFQITSIAKKDLSNSLTGTLTTEKDTDRYADRIIINGYEKAPKGFIKHYARIKEGKPFNQKELIEQNERLNNLSFISSKKDPEVLFTKDSTTVYFYLERKVNNRFDGFLGFATNEETNRLQLDGYIDLILTNNLNYGETLLLNYKSDGEDQTQLNIKATLPYLFKSPLGVEAQLSLFRKDSTFSENSQEVSLFYQVNANNTISLGYKSKQSEDLIESTDINEVIEDFTQQRVLGSFKHTNLQSDFFFPTKTQLIIEGELGNRQTTTSKEEQLSINEYISHIFKLNEYNQIYLQNRTQVLLSDSYLTNELYRFGGITSIRGFEENSIFANLVSTLNTEYRYVINSGIYIHSIIDLAYFENEIANQKEKLVSFGIGAGLRTKAGIFKINIANGKTENQTFRFSNTKLHFQLAIRF